MVDSSLQKFADEMGRQFDIDLRTTGYTSLGKKAGVEYAFSAAGEVCREFAGRRVVEYKQ